MATGSPRPTRTGVQKSVDSVEDFRLTYDGKASEERILRLQPAKPYRIWPTGDQREANALYFGENLGLLSHLHRKLRGGVRLVYIDPPFASRMVYHSRSEDFAYTDLLDGAKYIEFLRKRLIFLRELLSEDGSIYVHLDAKMAFAIKVVMDEVFGRNRFRNWITRRKCNPKNYTRNSFGSICDYILFYTKSDRYVWNPQHEAWDEGRAKEYRYVEKETGRRFMKVPVHAPGTRNGETGRPWRGKLPPPGKHWQYTPKQLEEMDQRGEIVWSPNGNPRRKVYLDESNGIRVQDLWLDMPDAHNQNIKITGYPTEKNYDLLKRIVSASSNSGDLVLDCFSGSGTTLHVASDLGRSWIGIDNSAHAIATTLQRFRHGPQRMGDYVAKRRQSEKELPLLAGQETSESPRGRPAPAIRDFAIYHSEEVDAELAAAFADWQREDSESRPAHKAVQTESARFTDETREAGKGMLPARA